MYWYWLRRWVREHVFNTWGKGEKTWNVTCYFLFVILKHSELVGSKAEGILSVTGWRFEMLSDIKYRREKQPIRTLHWVHQVSTPVHLPGELPCTVRVPGWILPKISTWLKKQPNSKVAHCLISVYISLNMVTLAAPWCKALNRRCFVPVNTKGILGISVLDSTWGEHIPSSWLILSRLYYLPFCHSLGS